MVTTIVDLSKLSDVVKNEVVKKTIYAELVKEVNVIQNTDTSNLVKKAHCNTKIAEIEKKILDHDRNNKDITTQEFNRLTAENLAARLKQANLATKTDADDFVEKADLITN